MDGKDGRRREDGPSLAGPKDESRTLARVDYC